MFDELDELFADEPQVTTEVKDEPKVEYKTNGFTTAELKTLINKYHLGGIVDKAKWEVEDKTLTIRFMPDTKDMLGEITYENIPLPDGEFGVFDTQQLLKLISITDGNLNLDLVDRLGTYEKLKISDSKFNLSYALADISMISKVATVNEPPSYEFEADLTQEQVVDLIKAEQAIKDVNILSFEDNNIVFGEISDYSNKINYQLNAKINGVVNKTFNSTTFKEILSANKMSEFASLKVSSQGLMVLKFENTQYFIVAFQ